MGTAAATSASRNACAHCGLPVTAAGPDSDTVYCCRACRVVALIVGKQGEQSWHLLRLGLGTLLAMNIMTISLLLYSGSIEATAIPVFRLVLLGLAAPTLVILLPPFLAGALRECCAGSISLDALIACGSLTAFSVSAVNALQGAGAVYFDTATMLPVLVTFGKIIEASAKSRAADLLHSLEALLPPTALLVRAVGSAEVGIESLQPGDLIQVRPGERIAVDGTICQGTSSIEEAAFTGEFLPRLCGPGDSVIAGTVNGTGCLLVQAERTGAALLLHGIIAMIDDAWNKPSQAERFAQRAAALFLPALLVIAAGSVLAWSLLGDLNQGLLSALSVLVVACPCTIGIATPLATSLAIARAARAGIVVRGGSVMERMAETDLIFFDKTGTITAGQPVLQEIQMVDTGVTEEELLGRLSALESAGGHVLARAVAPEALRRGCEPGSLSQARVHPGSGISGEVTWRGVSRQVIAGSGAFVESEIAAGMGPSPLRSRGEGLFSPYPLALWERGRGEGVSTELRWRKGQIPHPDPLPEGEGELPEVVKGEKATTPSNRASSQGDTDPHDGGHTVIDVAWDGELRGRLLFADAVRPGARRSLEALGAYAISLALLSGDRHPAAASAARQTGITRVEAPRTPAQKLQAIADSIAAGRTVAMVGDGINDAPALAAAHTGIAFGAGTDLARQAGNVVILSGHLMQIPWLIGLSRRTGSIIRGNFAWSFGYNAIAIGAAASGVLHPLLAALAMVFSSLTVLGNSLRITAYPDDQGPHGEEL